MNPRLEQDSIAHRVRCQTMALGKVIDCTACDQRTFEGWIFDPSRDPRREKLAPALHEPEAAHELLRALCDMVEPRTGLCSRCREQVSD